MPVSTRPSAQHMESICTVLNGRAVWHHFTEQLRRGSSNSQASSDAIFPPTGTCRVPIHSISSACQRIVARDEQSSVCLQSLWDLAFYCQSPDWWLHHTLLWLLGWLMTRISNGEASERCHFYKRMVQAVPPTPTPWKTISVYVVHYGLFPPSEALWSKNLEQLVHHWYPQRLAHSRCSIKFSTLNKWTDKSIPDKSGFLSFRSHWQLL